MDDQTVIILMEVGGRLGMRAEAVADLLRRGAERFSAEAPTRETARAWLDSLRTDGAPHLFTVSGNAAAHSGSPVLPEHAQLSAAERLTRYRPVVTKQRRSAPVAVTAAQATELDKLSPSARITQYRTFQQAAQD